MEIVYALAIGVLAGSGVWLLLRPRTFQVLMGLTLVSYATNIFIYNTPKYESYQTELTFNGSSFDDRLKWTTGLFYFREDSPDDPLCPLPPARARP